MVEVTDSPRPPVLIRWVVAVLWVEMVLGTVGGALQVAVGHFSRDDEDTNYALMLSVGYPYILASLLLGVCAILVRRRIPRVRTTVVALQAFKIAISLAGVVLGARGGIISMLLAVFVIYGMYSAEGRQWFTRGTDIR